MADLTRAGFPRWFMAFRGAELVQLKAEAVGSPTWMLYRGLYQLSAQAPELIRFQDYWQGRHDLPDTLDAKTQERYRTLVELSHINYMRTVVDVIAERISLQGLWLPGDDEAADSETWALWEANDLDAWQSVAFSEMVAKRRAYWSVWFDETVEGGARIELEDALQVWVELDPGQRSRPAFAVKAYTDDWTGEDHAQVATPDTLYDFTRSPGQGWLATMESQPNRLGEVPFVMMANRPTLCTADTGYSAIEDVIPTQDRINQTILGRLLAGHTSAFMQRWATGIELEQDDDGKPIAPFTPGVTQLWTSESQEAKFGQFLATDLTNYIKGEEQDIQHIANTTRIPRHYLNPTGQAPSGDAMRSAEASLVSLVETVEAFASGPLKRVLRLARKAAGMADVPVGSELVWRDPEFQTFAQLVDGTAKLTQAGIASKQWAREKVGMTPATIARVEAELAADQLLDAALLAPEEPAAAPGAPTPPPAGNAAPVAA